MNNPNEIKDQLGNARLKILKKIWDESGYNQASKGSYFEAYHKSEDFVSANPYIDQLIDRDGLLGAKEREISISSFREWVREKKKSQEVIQNIAIETNSARAIQSLQELVQNNPSNIDNSTALFVFARMMVFVEVAIVDLSIAVRNQDHLFESISQSTKSLVESVNRISGQLDQLERMISSINGGEHDRNSTEKNTDPLFGTASEVEAVAPKRIRKKPQSS